MDHLDMWIIYEFPFKSSTRYFLQSLKSYWECSTSKYPAPGRQIYEQSWIDSIADSDQGRIYFIRSVTPSFACLH